jgi:hypothetical protein
MTSNFVDLLDYRRRVADLYAEARALGSTTPMEF